MANDARWETWEKDNKFEAGEWEALAMEKCEMVSEAFLAHYFEPHMCLACFGVNMFSMLRTRKEWPSGEVQIVTRKWCTGCGKFHMPQKYAVQTPYKKGVRANRIR